MNDLFDKIIETAIERIFNGVAGHFEAQIFSRFEKFVRSGIKLTFTEEEAAQLLGLEKTKLAAIRREGGINHYQYGKSATYGLHHLQEFAARHEVKNIPAIYTVKKEVSPFGIETEARLRKVG